MKYPDYEGISVGLLAWGQIEKRASKIQHLTQSYAGDQVMVPIQNIRFGAIQEGRFGPSWRLLRALAFQEMNH